MRYESEKARKIFNKVNRYAKPTSKGQNLITDDDDVVAVLSRRLVDEIFGSRMVDLESNTLNKKAIEFTTLATLYEANREILLGGGHQIDQGSRPDKAKEKIFWHELSDVWTSILTNIDIVSASMHDKEETGDARRIEVREEFLLGKPVAQLAMVKAYVALLHSKDKSGHALSHEEICRRFNQIDWTISAKHWQRVIMSADKILSGKSVVSLAADYIAYLAGCPFEKEELDRLKEKYQKLFTAEEQGNAVLPPRVIKG